MSHITLSRGSPSGLRARSKRQTAASALLGLLCAGLGIAAFSGENLGQCDMASNAL